MGIFSSIKDAILGKDAKPAPTPASTPKPTAKPSPAPTGNAWADAPKVEPTHPRQVTTIDVQNHLDSMPGADRLNWRTSIVDLMKLIGVDSDYESRKALAQELGRPDYSGSAEDNVWLHRRTMQELSKNGGTVPAEFLD
ncbi:DUF3597 domain-containing protein [Qipengyuania spongiae]|uniref:DUF3597 domain-containing protein n=1 Tax=Qipengyuania spongiae TaxID=2909673 RepID=A0ABY5T6F5_9SPHN|nr:DUF3597 domain-containing protein [Qipengyuania spongiae]UVI40534.1 DUF3597 domain-containing protein [Qipengyuania spongiae]